MSQAQEQTVDLDAVLKECAGEIDQLIKTEQERLAALKKNEGQVAKKEESSMKDASQEQSMKKDEGSGFESPAPEASAAPAASPDQSAPAAGGEDQGESLQSMVQGLDDDMLQELMQVVQMEMEGRSQSAQSAPNPMDQQQQSAPAPAAASPDMSAMGKSQEMYKKELDEVRQALKKSEDKSNKVEQAVTIVTDLFEKMVNRPVNKAVTDIRNVEFVDKGEKDLKKNEQNENISDEEFSKRAKKLANDRNELGKLTKNERESLSVYFATKRRSPEVLKLISK